MNFVELLSRWLHILPAIVLVGGTIAMRFAVVPVLIEGGEEKKGELSAAIRVRWARLVMMSIGLLLISGLYNAAMKAMSFELDGVYNGLLLVKILLALAIFFFASVLVGKSDNAKKFRDKEIFWLNVNMTLAIVLVCIAGFLKVSNYEPKTEEGSSRNSTTSAVKTL